MAGINHPYDVGSTFFISCPLSLESQCDRTINLVWWDVYCNPYEPGPLKPHKSKVNTLIEWLGVTPTLTLWFLDPYTLPVGDTFDGIYKLPSEDSASSWHGIIPKLEPQWYLQETISLLYPESEMRDPKNFMLLGGPTLCIVYLPPSGAHILRYMLSTCLMFTRSNEHISVVD